MNKITLVSALALASAAALPATSMAEVTGNIGFTTDYVYRGVQQATSSAFAGADYVGESGFYLGTWWADVGVGNETDLYFGWSGGSDTVTFKVGYTAYRYLDDFDGDYDEVNLGLYAGIFSLDVAIGEYDASTLWGLGDTDYLFTSVTLAPEKGPYYKLGIWSGDIVDDIFPSPNAAGPVGLTRTGDDSGSYVEIGYTHSLEEQGIDL
jgi:uncharacterized protein (TIGR02001 family)